MKQMDDCLDVLVDIRMRPMSNPDGRTAGQMDDRRTPYTYEQAAEVLGINAEAVRARLRRGSLRRGPTTNDSRPTVLLSPDDIATLRVSVRQVGPDDHSAVHPDPDGRSLKELVELLRVQTQRADAAQAEVAALSERAGRAEGEAEVLRDAVAHERRQVATALAAQQTAERAREAAEAEAAGVDGWPPVRAGRSGVVLAPGVTVMLRLKRVRQAHFRGGLEQWRRFSRCTTRGNLTFGANYPGPNASRHLLLMKCVGPKTAPHLEVAANTRIFPAPSFFPSMS